MTQTNCSILKNGQQLPANTLVHVEIQPDLPGEFGFKSAVEENGRLIIRFPSCSQQGIGANIKVYAKDCTAWVGRLVLPTGIEEYDKVIELQSGANDGPFELGQLQTIGKKIINVLTGQQFISKQASDFLLFYHYLNGKDILPLIKQRREIGFNELRVFGMCHNIIPFYPLSYPSYFLMLDSFRDILCKNGMRMQFVVFADAQHIIPSTLDQKYHYAAVRNVLEGSKNTSLELVNEESQNGVNAAEFNKPYNIYSSHGSEVADTTPPLPPWDFMDAHPGRSYDWPRKMHNAMEDLQNVYGVPTKSSEPMGCAEVAVNGRRDNNPRNFFDAGAIAALLTSGATFHSDQGIYSQLFSGKQLVCAEAFVSGLNAIPIRYWDGRYTAGHLSECPIEHRDDWSSRTYAKILSNTCVVVVSQKTEKWQLVPKGNWKVVRQNNSVIEMER